jgi:glycosyltransferase involved in cell wall biosynthesis
MQADILHLPKPDGFCTRLPFLYQPWDLQHLHFPQFFHPIQFWIRDRLYRSLCAQAKRVVVASAFTRGDLISQYDLPPERITTIPAAPVLPLYPEPKEPDLAKTRRKFGLPSRFLFFPAQTWPHKNHLALIDAQALIRQRHGLDVPIVCSGMKTDHYTVLEQRIKQHDLGRQFGFVGFVSAMEVRCLYQLCRGLVFPSKFEGFGLPVAEAFWAGVPVACSNATCLPELTGDAALQFPPDDTEAMAEAITRLWTDEELRGQLVSRGRQRVAALSWDRVARTYRALYRQVAGRELTTEDHQLLSGGT